MTPPCERHTPLYPIFVSLFKTKVGKFTEAEFEAAYQSFKATGRPRIFTFFREARVPATAEGLAGLTTIVRFQERLAQLGHFHTRYKSVEDLNLRFKDQLEKLVKRS